MSESPTKHRGILHKASGNPLARPRKHKPLSLPKCRPNERSRVNIGETFQRWRALKTAKGLRSDADVAQLLLNSMKMNPSTSACNGASNEKIKFSQVELQEMIQKEVCTAVRKNETKIQDLIKTVQHLENGVNYENVLKKLEARINKVSQRSEAALACMTKTKKKAPLPSPDSGNISVKDPEEESSSENRKLLNNDNGGNLCQVVETTKEALHRFRADNRALMAAITDLNEEASSPVLHESPELEEELIRSVKQEPEDQQGKENQTKEVKPLDGRNSPSHSDRDTEKLVHTIHSTDSPDRLSYAPFPGFAAPSTLNMEAAKYSAPQRVEVHLALIRNPTSLSVLWTVTEKDPSAPPMDSYTIYLTMETAKGSGVFPAWKTFGEVAATDLPMCVLIRKYKPGHKVCAAVVGKDVFGRYGPFSKVATAAIPD